MLNGVLGFLSERCFLKLIGRLSCGGDALFLNNNGENPLKSGENPLKCGEVISVEGGVVDVARLKSGESGRKESRDDSSVLIRVCIGSSMCDDVEIVSSSFIFLL